MLLTIFSNIRSYLLSALLVVCNVSFAQEVMDSVGYSLYARKTIAAQSAACYGGYLLFASKQVSKMTLYNLKTKKVLFACKMEPKLEMRGKTDIYHANNSSFGLQKFHRSDPFPLLYVSHRENNEGRGVMDVYRVCPFKTKRSRDYDSLAVEQVQTIYYPVATDDNALGSPWTAMDTQNDCMYTYSRNNRKKAANYLKCRISKFKIPKFDKKCPVVILNDSDIVESYELDYNAAMSQGACVYKDRLYIAQGVPRLDGNVYIRVVDLNLKRLAKTYELHKAGFEEEPEGCFVYDGKLMIATINRNIYQLDIPL